MAKAKKNEATGDDLLKTFAADTLVGDMRTYLLDRVRSQPKLWHLMSQQEQEDEIHAAQDAAEKCVREAVALVAAGGKKMVRGTLKQLTITDGIKAVIAIGKGTGLVHELMDAQGQVVCISVADSDNYMGEKEPEKAMPDQPALTFGGEDADAEELAAQEDEKVSKLR